MEIVNLIFIKNQNKIFLKVLRSLLLTW